MPALLESRVFLYPKLGKFPTELATLQLDEDNTIRLTKGDTVVFDESLTDVRIGGAGSSLTFVTANDRWRIDFSPYSAGQPVITTDQANQVVFEKAGIQAWVAKLKELGYPSHYRSARQVAVIAVVIGVVVVVLVVVIGGLFRPYTP